jgi:hypothetical protein
MVPYVASRKMRQRLFEFSFDTPKRLLQQYLPGPDLDGGAAISTPFFG